MTHDHHEISRAAGRRTTARKAAAVARNGRMPVKPGNRPRGWPKGKPCPKKPRRNKDA